MAEIGVVIVAGGSGKRMGAALPKQFMMLGNLPILGRTINSIREALPASQIVVVLPEDHIELWKNIAARFDVARHKIALGGKERFHSVKSGIEALSDAVDLIAIHDAVRPFASVEMIRSVAQCAAQSGAAIPVIEAVDSFRVVTDSGNSEIIDRSKLRIVQTPQIFEASVIRAAYDTEYQSSFTDDASVVEQTTPLRVTLCKGERNNIKITTPEDMEIAYAIAQSLKE